MPTKKKKYNARFPPARIKKIMQMDEEVGKVAAPVPVIISRALELFVESLIHKSSETTQLRNARTLTTSHIKQTIVSEKKYDFLKELVKNVSDIQPNEEDCAKTKSRDSSSMGPRPRGRPRKKLPDDSCPSSKDRIVKRRGPRKKVEQKVELKPEEKEVETESSSDTDIVDADDNGENGCSGNEDEDEDDDETDTDIENDAGIVTEMHDRMSCSSYTDDSKPLSSDRGYSGDTKHVGFHAGFSSVSSSSAYHTCDTVAVHSYLGADMLSPTSDDMEACPLNLKVVPARSAFGSSPCPGQVSHVIQQSAVAMSAAKNRQLSLGLNSSVGLDDADMNVNIPLQGTRTTRSLSTHNPGALGNNTPANPGFATHRMPPVLSLSSFHSPSTHVCSSPRPLTPMPMYRTQDPLSLPSRLPSALNESNKFH